MDIQPMFVITKSGLIIRPEGIELSIAHTRHYIDDLKNLLAEFQYEAARARTIAPEGIPQEDSIVTDTKRGLARAYAHLDDLTQVRGHLTRLYDRNFKDWADVFRQTRIELGLEKIEDSTELHAAVQRTMEMLKTENHWFSESKFITYINKAEEAIYNDVKLDKRVYAPMTGANPTGRYSAQIRIDGWAQDEAFFDTKEEVQAWLDNYQYDGKIGEGARKDYQAVLDKWAKKALEGQEEAL